jgi:hypothetical protein
MLVICICLLAIGCASFEPGLRQQDLARNRLPTINKTQNGLEVSIEEFVSSKKSLQAFDADVAGKGVLALLVRVDNNSNASYRLARTQIKALLDGESLPTLEGRDAAEQAAAKDLGGRALAWTLATGPFALVFAPLTLVASSAHTNSVNQRIGQYFGEMEFPDALVRRDESVSGFVYFKLPFRLQRIENLTVEIEPIEDATEQKLSYRFNLPAFDIELPYSLRDRKIDND